MSAAAKSTMQVMLDAGLNAFGAQLLCESFLKSPLAARVLEDSAPLSIFLPIRREDCAGWAGVEVSLFPVASKAWPDEQLQEKLARFQRHAQQLVEFAERAGLVLTIERRPLQPLAMGHAETVVDVRPARVMAAEAGAAP